MKKCEGLLKSCETIIETEGSCRISTCLVLDARCWLIRTPAGGGGTPLYLELKPFFLLVTKRSAL